MPKTFGTMSLEEELSLYIPLADSQNSSDQVERYKDKADLRKYWLSIKDSTLDKRGKEVFIGTDFLKG